MADININANGCSNSKAFPKAQASISFSGAATMTVNLNPTTGNCFGDVSSFSLSPGNNWSHNVVSDVTTGFTPSISCPTDTTYDITFDSTENDDDYDDDEEDDDEH